MIACMHHIAHAYDDSVGRREMYEMNSIIVGHIMETFLTNSRFIYIFSSIFCIHVSQYNFDSVSGDSVIHLLEFIIKYVFDFSIFFFSRCVAAKYYYVLLLYF